MTDTWKSSPLRRCEDNKISSETVVCVGWTGGTLMPSHPLHKKSWIEPDGLALEFESREDAAKFRILYSGDTRVKE